MKASMKVSKTESKNESMKAVTENPKESTTDRIRKLTDGNTQQRNKTKNGL